MNQVHVLVPGYAHPGENGVYVASPTSTLVDTGGQKILVDPGTTTDELLLSLDKFNLKNIDILKIFLTHYHPDHFLSLRLFSAADVFDGTTQWTRDLEIPYQDFIPGTDIKLLPTPGHSPEHTSLLVSTKEGIVCVAADVFWWEDGAQKTDNLEELLNYPDPFATDLTALKKSRQLVLNIADWIIPGHGVKFKNQFKK